MSKFKCDPPTPEYKRKFQDRPVRTYSGPGKGKPRKKASEISFSPKWANRVESKFDSPSDVPRQECTMTFLSDSPGGSSWFDGASSESSPTENKLWEDFVEGTQTLPKSSTHILRKRVLNHHPGWSPPHRVNRIEVFDSPTRESVYDEEKVHPHGCIVVKQDAKKIKE